MKYSFQIKIEIRGFGTHSEFIYANGIVSRTHHTMHNGDALPPCPVYIWSVMLKNCPLLCLPFPCVSQKVSNKCSLNTAIYYVLLLYLVVNFVYSPAYIWKKNTSIQALNDNNIHEHITHMTHFRQHMAAK
jgi:hypothetical protein